jgi:hypothetical protein
VQRLRPLFRLAAINGIEASIREHLRRGVDVNATDIRGCSPLMLAATGGHLRACEILIEAGADLRAVDVDGNDAISLATANGHSAVAELLHRHLTPLAETAVATSFNDGSKANVDSIELSAWEAEGETALPVHAGAPVVADIARVQRTISEHSPINHDDDWLDVLVELPSVSAYRREVLDDAERAALREIIITGVRTGVVPAWRVAALAAVGSRDADLRFSDYVAYSGFPGHDPRTASTSRVSEGIVRIVEVEGPMVAKRAYDIYLKGCGVKRMGRELESTMNEALTRAIRLQVLVSENEASNGGLLSSIVRIAGSPPIKLRTRGPRSFEEIPPSELQVVARYLLERDGVPSGSDEHLRAVLERFDLKRLTTQMGTSLREVIERTLPYVDEFLIGIRK